MIIKKKCPFSCLAHSRHLESTSSLPLSSCPEAGLAIVEGVMPNLLQDSRVVLAHGLV